MERGLDLVSQAEEFAGTDNVIALVKAVWQDPDVGRRLLEQRDETLVEFGIVLPKHLDLVPLGLGRRGGKPTPDFTPFEIRLTRCRTILVRNPDTGLPQMETVCFGIEIVPTKGPPPIG
ncbi:hypothetical protein JF66_15525 [Cryobacterium sp. MLB-32]|uniref:hypothetical protein n=1 Tax=Cryobacterium sp. MLB-32 TaxID=1529318 RepID=UPI0004E78637|nr:hypothetical protein [Cryobacterium sp. MLB-32]KFF58839.1 hypothetical protein JF66_15545 [Cryobacterium sp. MLB-32]KFF58843.1 hypothetical protein JF66_15525 [Cryobacterium sp. MLB-32]